MAVMTVHFLVYRSDKTGMASCHACVKIHFGDGVDLC